MKKLAVFLVVLGGSLCTAGLWAAQTTIPEDNPGREKLASWLKANRLPVFASTATKSVQEVDEALMHDQTVELRYGADLLNSHKATILWLVDESFVPIEYTRGQAEKLGIANGDAILRTYPQTEGLHGYSLFEISDLAIENADHLDESRPIKGSLMCKPMHPESLHPQYIVRLWIVANGRSTMFPCILPLDAFKEGKIAFETLGKVMLKNSLRLLPGEPATAFVTISYPVRRASRPYLDIVCSNALGKVISVDDKTPNGN